MPARGSAALAVYPGNWHLPSRFIHLHCAVRLEVSNQFHERPFCLGWIDQVQHAKTNQPVGVAQKPPD